MIGYPHVARRRAIQFQHKSRRDRAQSERDPAVLRDGVLRELAVSAWRGMGTTSVEPTTAAKPPSNSRALHHYELGPVGVFNLIRPAHALAIDTAQGEPKGRGRAVCGREPVRDSGETKYERD